MSTGQLIVVAVLVAINLLLAAGIRYLPRRVLDAIARDKTPRHK